MKCSRCGGKMEPQTTKFCVPNTNPPILIENVPAHVCNTCGGELFSEATSKEFARIRRGEVKNFEFRVLKVFDFLTLDDLVTRDEFQQQPGIHWDDWKDYGSSTDSGGKIIIEPNLAATTYVEA